MKHLAIIFTLILASITGVGSLNAKTVAKKTTTAKTTSISGNPLTQYALVYVHSGTGTADLRKAPEMAKILKGLGFQVSYNSQKLNASRNGTTILYDYSDSDMGGEPICTINFRNAAETNQFVSSLQKSGWSRHGAYYLHPASEMSGVQAKVTGTKVVLLSFWEGPSMY